MAACLVGAYTRAARWPVEGLAPALLLGWQGHVLMTFDVVWFRHDRLSLIIMSSLAVIVPQAELGAILQLYVCNA